MRYLRDNYLFRGQLTAKERILQLKWIFIVN